MVKQTSKSLKQTKLTPVKKKPDEPLTTLTQTTEASTLQQTLQEDLAHPSSLGLEVANEVPNKTPAQPLHGTPVQPKKAKNPYIYFLQENMAQFQKDYQMTPNQAVAKVGEVWRDMSATKKKKYLELA